MLPHGLLQQNFAHWYSVNQGNQRLSLLIKVVFTSIAHSSKRVQSHQHLLETMPSICTLFSVAQEQARPAKLQ
jgi:hypothetical protein